MMFQICSWTLHPWFCPPQFSHTHTHQKTPPKNKKQRQQQHTTTTTTNNKKHTHITSTTTTNNSRNNLQQQTGNTFTASCSLPAYPRCKRFINILLHYVGTVVTQQLFVRVGQRWTREVTHLNALFTRARKTERWKMHSAIMPFDNKLGREDKSFTFPSQCLIHTLRCRQHGY